MKQIFANGNKNTIKKLLRLRKKAIKDNAVRVALRIQAVILSIEKYNCPEIANILKVNRTTIPIWINNWNIYKEEGLLDGYRSGRNARLKKEDYKRLNDIIESGPVAYGLNSGVWTSIIITSVIEEEFGVSYHPGHVRKILKKIGCSVQRPTIKLINGDPVKKKRWTRYSYPNLKKKAKAEEGIIVYIDEASFRQTPTLYRTWALKNSQPKISTKGLRNTQKFFGAICLSSGKFIYKHQEEYFNYKTYLDFLENYLLPNFYKEGHRIFLIQDNAGYHKKSETYSWFKSNRKYIEVANLPPYSPEFNAVERIWNFTRKNCTHNRYFETKEDLCNAIFQNFAEIQKKPEKIMNLLHPFF